MNLPHEQSRLYLGLGRDGLLPPIFAKVHHTRHTPVQSQVWVGIVASILAGLFNVHVLSHILSVGSLVSWQPLSVNDVLNLECAFLLNLERCFFDSFVWAEFSNRIAFIVLCSGKHKRKHN